MGKPFDRGRSRSPQDADGSIVNSRVPSPPATFQTFPKILLAASMSAQNFPWLPQVFVLVHPKVATETPLGNQECTLRIYRHWFWGTSLEDVSKTYDSADLAIIAANEFLKNPSSTASALKLFQSGEPNYVSLYDRWRSVRDESSEIAQRVDHSPLEINGDSILSMGIHFSLLLSVGKYPTSVDGWKNLTNYLQVVPLRIGYFGDFKKIIKSLESVYIASTDAHVKKYCAGLLGIAFGRIESIMISSSHKARAEVGSNREWHLDYLRYFAEGIDISVTPSFATCRYLMNRGLKFLRMLEGADANNAYIFKLNLLQVVDRDYVDISGRDSLPNQWITSEILYGRRYRYSKSTPLATPAVRHNSDVTLPVPPDGSAVKGEFLSSFIGKHPDIFLALLRSSERLGVSIEWNSERIAAAFAGHSSYAQSKAWDAILIDSDLILALDVDALNDVLLHGDIKFVRVFLDVVDRRVNDRAAQKLIIALVQWLKSTDSSSLNDSQIEIMLSALPHYAHPWDETYLSRVKDLAILTGFEPVQKWTNIFYKLRGYYSFLGLFFERDKIDDYQYSQEEIDNIFKDIDPLFLSLRKIAIPPEIQEVVIQELLTFGYPTITVKFFPLTVILQSCFIDSPAWMESFGFKVINKIVSDEKQGEVFYHLVENLTKADLSPDNFLLSYTQNAFTVRSLSQITVITDYLGSSVSDSFWRKSESELVRIFLDPHCIAGIWQSFSRMGPRLVSRLKIMDGFAQALVEFLERSHVIAMDQGQADFIAEVIESHPGVLSRPELVDALLVAPYGNIHRFVIKGIELKDTMQRHWLVAIESGLPIPAAAAKRYLLSQASVEGFKELLLMALDSNVDSARASALQVLADPQIRTNIEDLLVFLSEHTSRDIVELVAKNLAHVQNPEIQQRFTQDLFATRRQNRRAKDVIKRSSNENDEELSESISVETLIRLSLGSNLRDREFAMAKIALMSLESESVSVLETWGDGDV